MYLNFLFTLVCTVQNTGFNTLQGVSCFNVKSDAALIIPLAVDLTGNLILIEKLVLGGTCTGDLPMFSPDVLTSVHQDKLLLCGFTIEQPIVLFLLAHHPPSTFFLRSLCL